jgi:hypothetical protein
VTELELVRKKIRQKMNEIADDLALGTAKDYADYKFLTGIISGLALVERDIVDLLEKQDED